MLITFFNEGMTSTKKAMCDKIRPSAARVGTSKDQVMVFLLIYTPLKTDFCFFYSAHTKKTVTTQREEQKKYMLILKKKV